MTLAARPLAGDVETVQCPACGKERPAEPGLYVCARCGCWFEVEEEAGR